MADNRQQFGKMGEELAVAHLRKKGYKVIQRNYRTRIGEIDIIARYKGRIVFVEVKTRRSGSYGNPKFAVTPKKQRRISMVALEYLKKHHSMQTPARFDVVTVNTEDEGNTVDIIPNAFELAYG
ncbi:MAG: YraN family protein [Desulfobacteraceae bacterium]|jgi:putative endonuclease